MIGGNNLVVLLCAIVFILFSRTVVSQELHQDHDSSRIIAEILVKAQKYCRKLERAALDYVCTEKIEEEIIQQVMESRTRVNPRTAQTTLEYTPSEQKLKNTYVYDYQMIRKDRRFEEHRTLIDENGKECRIPNARLKTTFVEFRNGVFGPVGLLSTDKQQDYNYRILEKIKESENEIVVISVHPKDLINADQPYGKIWIKTAGFGVLKIEWYQESLGNFPAIMEYAKKQNAKPSITAYTEFGYEKNGIRFPSRMSIEEAYIKKKDKKEIRSLTVVEYVDYKFFTVETKIDYN